MVIMNLGGESHAQLREESPPLRGGEFRLDFPCGRYRPGRVLEEPVCVTQSRERHRAEGGRWGKREGRRRVWNTGGSFTENAQLLAELEDHKYNILGILHPN